MENLNNDFSESIVGSMFEIEQLGFYLSAVDSPGPEDDDDDDKGDGTGSDDPPLDGDVVHSPLPPKTGKP